MPAYVDRVDAVFVYEGAVIAFISCPVRAGDVPIVSVRTKKV